MEHQRQSMNITPLTTGALEKIFGETEVKSPVLQVVNLKSIKSNGQEYLQLQVSDGTHSTGFCVLGRQLNIIAENIKNNAVIEVNRYMCHTVNASKKVIIILDLLVLGEEIEVIIGSPVSYKFLEKGSSNEAVRKRGSISDDQSSASKGASRVLGGVDPINSLTLQKDKWKICARVWSKTPIKLFNKARGQGKVFFINLVDEDGEIRALAFDAQCDRLYNMIEIDKVYYISRAKLQPAKKQQSSLNHACEILLNKGTQITLCQEKTNIPTLQFNFVAIDQLVRIEKGTSVDVIGVCKEASKVTIISRAGKEQKIKNVQIVDETGKEVRLVLWGTEAENFSGSRNSVIAVKDVKVGDFNGKWLSVLTSSSLRINPDIDESHKLRAWFDKIGCNIQTVNISGQRGIEDTDENLKTIGEAVAENIGCEGQEDYYCTKATLFEVRREHCLYPACPSDRCGKKKVIDLSNGLYLCEKCNQTYNKFNWRMILNAIIADGTDGVLVTIYQEQAETLLGYTSSDLGVMREQDENDFQAVVNSVMFREFIFNLAVKMDHFNDEKRLKTIVSSIQPVDCREYNKSLFQQIKNSVGLP